MSLGAGGCGTAYLAFRLTGAPSTSSTTFAVGFVLGSALAVPRSLALGADVDSSGLTIRNYFRTYSIPWSDVDAVGWARVSIGGAHAWGYAPALAVRLRSGGTVTARATYGLLAPSRERLVATLEQHARVHDVRVDLAEDDLYFGLKRVKRPHSALTDIAR
jgi:Bacterial PH domain